MANKYKVVLFGSDLISLRVLQSLHLAAQQQVFSSLKVVCPPYKKPKTPLADFHSYLKNSQLPILKDFGTDTPLMW